MLALGLVETKGLVGAVEAADAMLKTADVRLLEKSLATGGLVTITVAGDVAAVKASVSAASARVAQIAGAELVSTHVIPRPDPELRTILRLDPEPERPVPPVPPAPPAPPAPKAPADRTVREEEEPPKEEPEPEPAADPDPAEAPGPAGDPEPEAPDAPEAAAQAAPEERGPADPDGDPEPAQQALEAELKAMSLAALRSRARGMALEIHGKGISSAGKKALIAAILKASGNNEE